MFVVLVWRGGVHTSGYLRHRRVLLQLEFGVHHLVALLRHLLPETHQLIFVPERCNDKRSYGLMTTRYMPGRVKPDLLPSSLALRRAHISKKYEPLLCLR